MGDDPMPCPYCRCSEMIDCGPIADNDSRHHYECPGCKMAHLLEPPPAHGLTHVEMADNSGRFTPACTCGWWSPNCSHADYERHIRKTNDRSES